jgi:hypothetical protein
MSYKTTIAAIVAAMGLVPLAVHAQDDGSNFARDRNTSVTERIPAGYEPLGLHVGGFNVAPTLSIGLEKNDNIYYQAYDKTSDAILETAPGVTITSDWGRHELTATLSADYDAYEKHTSENTLSWNSGIAGRLDIHGANYLFGGLGYSENYEPPYAPDVLALNEIVHPIKYDAAQANLGFVVQGNRLKFTGSGAYADYTYFNTTTLTGIPVAQNNRDYDSYIWTGRLDYAVSPDTAIYGVLDDNTRNYRLASAKSQGSNGYDFKVGADFDITNLVRGHAAVGYLSQSYKNPLYKDTTSPAFNVAVEYFPTEMTTIHFTANTTVNETPQINASGYVSNDLGIGIDHELLRNFVLSANYEYIMDKYHGFDINRHDDRSALNFSGRYLLNRNVTINAGYTFSELESHGAQAIRSFQDNAFRVSLGLQY